MVRVAVVEDNKRDADILIRYIKRFTEQKNYDEIVVDYYDNGFQFIADYKAVYDIIFLDIEMPQMDGLNVARRLREVDQSVCILFVTNLGKYAIYGYEVDALDFLVKPVTYFNFSEKMKKALSKCESNKTAYLLVPTDSGVTKLMLKNILYVDKNFHDIIYHTAEFDYCERKNLKEVEELFLKNNFVKLNRGCLVNICAVSKFTRDCIILGDKTLPVSRAMKKECFVALIRFMREGECR